MGRAALAGAALTLAALLAWFAALPADDASAAFPGAPGLIALARAADPDESSIWVLDWRTGAARQLTQEGYAADPAFSPNGRWISFRSDASRYGRLNIWAIRADGTGLHRLILGHGELEADSPAFSANGRWVAFTAASPNGGRQIERVALSGGHRRVLVPGAPRRSAATPDYSPDGRHLAWVQGPEMLRGNAEPHIYVGNAMGRGGRRLTNGDEPQFSPDGRSIVFTRRIRCSGRVPGAEIDIHRLDSGQEWHLKQVCGAELWAPTYSPDGAWIAYSIFTGEKSELGFLPVPGAMPSYQPLSGLGNDLPVDQEPSWQPLS